MPDIPSIAGCIQDGKGRLERKGAATSSTLKSWLLFLSNCHTSGRWRTGPALRGSSSPWASSGRQEWPLLGIASPVVPLQGQQEPSHRLDCFCLPRAHKTGPGQISAGTPVPGMSPKKHTSQQTLCNVISLWRKTSSASTLALYLAWVGLPDNEVLSILSICFFKQMLVKKIFKSAGPTLVNL